MIFKRYTDFLYEDTLCDMHMHSIWTDGEGTIEENIMRAKELGLKRIAATDHIRADSIYFDDYYKEIHTLKDKHQFEIYVGFEAKVNNFEGDIDVSQQNLKKADLSICSVHRFPIGRKLIPAKAFSSSVAQEIELELAMAAVKKGGFSVLGHPGGMSIRAHNEFKAEYFEEIIAACAKTSIAFDFNASYHQDVKDVLKPLFEKYNPYVSIGSDAHRVAFIGTATTTLF
jgi:putative hydrolase